MAFKLRGCGVQPLDNGIRCTFWGSGNARHWGGFQALCDGRLCHGGDLGCGGVRLSFLPHCTHPVPPFGMKRSGPPLVFGWETPTNSNSCTCRCCRTADAFMARDTTEHSCMSASPDHTRLRYGSSREQRAEGPVHWDVLVTQVRNVMHSEAENLMPRSCASLPYGRPPLLCWGEPPQGCLSQPDLRNTGRMGTGPTEGLLTPWRRERPILWVQVCVRKACLDTVRLGGMRSVRRPGPRECAPQHLRFRQAVCIGAGPQPPPPSRPPDLRRWVYPPQVYGTGMWGHWS